VFKKGTILGARNVISLLRRREEYNEAKNKLIKGLEHWGDRL
jgi:hypothetical protein